MRALRLALPLLVVAGCTPKDASKGPVPLAVNPAQTTGLAPLTVEVTGEGFEATVQTDFTGRTPSTVQGAFQVQLTPSGGGTPVALGQVTLTPARTLTAVVPAGIARGTYDLQVIDPSGRSGVLLRAFRVVSSAESVTTFKVDLVEAALAGVPFLVSLSALDASGQVVDGFTGTASVSDLTGTVSPATVGPFVAGRLQTRVAVRTVTAADTLTVSDALGRSGTSAPFAVAPGPPVALGFASAPVSAKVGTCSPPISLELRDVLGNATAATAPVAVTLQSAPAGTLTFYSDAGCAAASASVTIAAGATQAAFRFTGAAVGPVSVRAVPAGLPSAQQGETVTP